MIWCAKPLPDLMFTQSTDMYMHDEASIMLIAGNADSAIFQVPTTSWPQQEMIWF